MSFQDQHLRAFMLEGSAQCERDQLMRRIDHYLASNPSPENLVRKFMLLSGDKLVEMMRGYLESNRDAPAA